MTASKGKPLVWLHGEVKTPPLSLEARVEFGVLLRRLQSGERLTMPESRPMPGIGARCHELRVDDVERKRDWRLMYGIDKDAIVIADVVSKTTRATVKRVVDSCQERFAKYDKAGGSR